MLSESYKKGISEVLEILKYSGKKYIEKIPKKLLIFLKENASETYKPQIDVNKKIEDMNLLPETKGLLSLLYMDYWATPEEKEEFQGVLKDNQKKIEEEIREKYSPDKIFDRPDNQVNNYKQESKTNNYMSDNNVWSNQNDETTQGVSEDESLVEYKEGFMTGLIKKIKEFIKNLFNKD